MAQLTPQDMNIYLSWLIPVIMGQLQEADTIAYNYQRNLYKVATLLQQKNRQPVRRLYRGILLEPEQAESGYVGMHSDLPQSVSFTEDRDVACYFAVPDTIMSSFMTQTRPRVQGYIIEHTPQRADILWHYRWNPIVLKHARIDIRVAARQHPLIQDPGQFEFLVDTQREVILKPTTQPLPITPVGDSCPDTEELNRRFTPPHILPFF